MTLGIQGRHAGSTKTRSRARVGWFLGLTLDYSR